ncbi:MAG: hypothetical protein AAB403_22015 [Planctomycetota bacterium]
MLWLTQAHGALAGGLASAQPLTTASVTTWGNLRVPWRVIPDLAGSVFATVVNQDICTSDLTPDRILRVDASGAVTAYLNTDGLDIELTGSAGAMFPSPFQQPGPTVAKDVATLSTLWTAPGTAAPVHPLDDRGVSLADGTVLDATGAVVTAGALTLQVPASVVRDGEHMGTRYDQVLQQNVIVSAASPLPARGKLAFAWGGMRGRGVRLVVRRMSRATRCCRSRNGNLSRRAQIRTRSRLD